MNKIKTLKIKVIQYMYGYCEYFRWSETINRSYCDLHGYEYVIRHDYPRTDRYPSWQKIEIIQQELENCDYLLYLDADAFFYSREFWIEWELLPLLDSKSIMMTQNFTSEQDRREFRCADSGVILLKNDTISKKFLESWNNSSAKDPVGCWIAPYENINLWRITLPIYKQSIVLLDDYYQMNGHFGLFIRHLHGLSDEECTRQMLHFINTSHTNIKNQKTLKKPFIRVVQYMYGDHEYFQWSSLINADYCKLYKYKYEIDRSEPSTDRHLVWQKTTTMLRYIDDCDYLLFIDADAIFYGREWSIEERLLPLMEGHDLLMAQDITYERSRWTPGHANAGVIFMKQSTNTRHFLEMWNKMPDIDKTLRNIWPPMQMALWRYMMPTFPNMVKVHNEYYLLNGALGQYIRHYMVHSNEARTNAMRIYCEQRQIPVNS